MKMKTMLFGGALMAAGVSSGASAQNVMDFQSLEEGGTGFAYHGFSYSANGFTVSHPNSEPFTFATPQTENGSFYQGSTMMFNNTVGGVMTFSQDNGNPFDMDSIVLASLFVGGGIPTINFVGNVNGGGTVTASVSPDSSTGGTVIDMAALGFANLDSLVWVQENSFHQFDDITVGVVPAPASLALLGLGGLVATRRRR